MGTPSGVWTIGGELYSLAFPRGLDREDLIKHIKTSEAAYADPITERKVYNPATKEETSVSSVEEMVDMILSYSQPHV
jgi:hypothetical protein